MDKQTYMISQLTTLTGIPSPTGMTREITDYLLAFGALGLSGLFQLLPVPIAVQNADGGKSIGRGPLAIVPPITHHHSRFFPLTICQHFADYLRFLAMPLV